MARPVKENSKRHTSRIVFACTAEDERVIKELAKAHGFAELSVFARAACLGEIAVKRRAVCRIRREGAVPLVRKSGRPRKVVPADSGVKVKVPRPADAVGSALPAQAQSVVPSSSANSGVAQWDAVEMRFRRPGE